MLLNRKYYVSGSGRCWGDGEEVGGQRQRNSDHNWVGLQMRNNCSEVWKKNYENSISLKTVEFLLTWLFGTDLDMSWTEHLLWMYFVVDLLSTWADLLYWWKSSLIWFTLLELLIFVVELALPDHWITSRWRFSWSGDCVDVGEWPVKNLRRIREILVIGMQVVVLDILSWTVPTWMWKLCWPLRCSLGSVGSTCEVVTGVEETIVLNFLWAIVVRLDLVNNGLNFDTNIFDNWFELN